MQWQWIIASVTCIKEGLNYYTPGPPHIRPMLSSASETCDVSASLSLNFFKLLALQHKI